MLPYKRSERVAELLREKICQILLEVGTPTEAGLITVTGVSLTEDLSEANIYYSVLGDERQKKAAEEFFQKNIGTIRHYLGEGLILKKVPHIRFSLDDTAERAARIFTILDKITPTETAKKVKKRSVKKRKSKKSG